MKSTAAGAGEAPPVPPPFEPTQEVRFAVVMYGGVSLAIYINGVSQELLRLVRATAPHSSGWEQAEDPALTGRALLADAELSGSEKVYRKVGQLLGRDLVDEPMSAPPKPEDPIRTRFVVDILSGSSAGGINAVYLGKALATGQGIEVLRDLWMHEADVELLLNDSESAPSKELPVAKEPASLFNSQRMYWRLLDALDRMDLQESVFPARTSCFVDELDVWLTATDLQGLLLPIELADRTVWELRYRNVFHFAYGSEYGRGEGASDFERADNPFLAYACRCTASFPFAFEPMTLADIDAVIDCQPFGWYQQQGLKSDSTRWAKYFRDYGDPEYFRDRAFADGGYLDNKPFTWATRNLRRRRRDLAVDRRLLYIEPDPGSLAAVPNDAPGGGAPPGQPPVKPRPNALGNVQAATLSLPRKESIRDDLSDLLERNRAIDELGRVRRFLERASNDLLAPFAEVPLATWRTTPATALIAERGPMYGAYHRLKIAQACTDIGRIAGGALGFDEQSDEQEAMTRVVRLWGERRYPERGRGKHSQNEFLLRFDLGYRTRRLNFLLDRTTRLIGLDSDALETLSMLGPFPEDEDWRRQMRDWMYLLRRELGDAIVTLRATSRLLAGTDPGNPLRPILRELDVKPQDIARILAGTESDDEAREAMQAQMNRLAQSLADTLAPVFARQHEWIDHWLGDPAAEPDRPAGELLGKRVMRHYWNAFETYDAVLFPIGYGVVGEADRVEVTRISPADATSLVDERVDGKRKLGGTAIFHFGGFFDERWRRNDFLWGRLDAADRLITTLLPPSPIRDDLLREAQLAIIGEEFDTATRTPITGLVVKGLLAHRDGHPDDDGFLATLTDQQARDAVAAASTPEALLAYYDDAFEIDRQPDTTKMLQISGRALTITGRIFDGLSSQAQVGIVARWMSRVGRLLTGTLALATGQNLRDALWRNALVLPLVAAVLLVLMGTVLSSDPTSHAGFAILVATLATMLFLGIARDALRGLPPSGKRAWTFLVLRLGGLAFLAFTVFAALEWGLPR